MGLKNLNYYKFLITRQCHILLSKSASLKLCFIPVVLFIQEILRASHVPTPRNYLIVQTPSNVPLDRYVHVRGVLALNRLNQTKTVVCIHI